MPSPLKKTFSVSKKMDLLSFNFKKKDYDVACEHYLYFDICRIWGMINHQNFGYLLRNNTNN